MNRGDMTVNVEQRLDAGDINERSRRWIAGGVVSINRMVDPPLVFVRAKGNRIYDTEGREYIDYHAGFAPHLLGHNPPEVVAAVRDCLEAGQSLMGAGTTPWEVGFAEAFCRAVPTVDCIQLLNTGSEATALAIRLARACTGKEKVLMPLGGYNGWHDESGRAVMPGLDSVGPRIHSGTYDCPPISAGIPASTRSRWQVVNFNDLAQVEEVLSRGETACVLTEPVLQNVGVIPPCPGYLEGLRELCDRYGVILIFDEVKTGFRTALGGYQSVCGVTPDLSVFGKAVASGYPLAVLGGKRKLMERFADPDPVRRVLVAGTYNGHPVNVAAGLATLKVLEKDGGAVYSRLASLTDSLVDGLGELLRERGICGVVARNGSAFCLYFMDHQPVDWHDALEHHDFDLDRKYRRALIDRGIFHFPLPSKQGSVSASHTSEDIDRTLSITREVLENL